MHWHRSSQPFSLDTGKWQLIDATLVHRLRVWAANAKAVYPTINANPYIKWFKWFGIFQFINRKIISFIPSGMFPNPFRNRHERLQIVFCWSSIEVWLLPPSLDNRNMLIYTKPLCGTVSVFHTDNLALHQKNEWFDVKNLDQIESIRSISLWNNNEISSIYTNHTHLNVRMMV